MLVLITYDVNTQTKAGINRLRKVAKQCTNFGVRVQNSVFECNIDNAQFIEIQHRLRLLINEDLDSLRFYMIGNNYKTKVVHYGVKNAFDVTEPLIV